MKRLQILQTVSAVVLLSFFIVTPAFAQLVPPPSSLPGNLMPPPSTQLINPLQGGCPTGTPVQTCILNLLNKILDFVIRIGSVAIVFMVVYIGYLFVLHSHEPNKIAEARQALLWTLIGALVLLGSKAIALGIEATVQALSVGS